MYRLFDFECETCHKVFEALTNGQEIYCGCGSRAAKVYRSFNIAGCDSFNPHYDLQLGQHFNSREEKKKFLQETGRVQVSGNPSPRSSNKTSIICDKQQAKKEFGVEAPKQAWSPSVDQSTIK